MTWQQQLVCRILLVIARMISDGETRDEIKALDLHIRHSIAETK